MRWHTDFRGNTTVEVYDDSAAHDGRLQAEYRFAADATIYSGSTLLVNNASEKTEYQYDSLSRQHTVTDYSHTPGSGTWNADTSTTTSYDPITQNVSSIASPEGTINYEYDPATGRHVRTYPGHDTVYADDPQRRLAFLHSVVLNDTRYANYLGLGFYTHQPAFAGEYAVDYRLRL